jgi:hypothetical protein
VTLGDVDNAFEALALDLFYPNSQGFAGIEAIVLFMPGYSKLAPSKN